MKIIFLIAPVLFCFCVKAGPLDALQGVYHTDKYYQCASMNENPDQACASSAQLGSSGWMRKPDGTLLNGLDFELLTGFNWNLTQITNFTLPTDMGQITTTSDGYLYQYQGPLILDSCGWVGQSTPSQINIEIHFLNASQNQFHVVADFEFPQAQGCGFQIDEVLNKQGGN